LDYKENILGSWQAINSITPGFKMTDSTLVLLDSTFFGLEAKYNITGDTLTTIVTEGQSSKYKIILLTKDSLKTLDKNGILESYVKIK
jgi:hypothetical protein